MEEYIALSYIFKLSTELSKEPPLFYRLGYLFGYRGEELICLICQSKIFQGTWCKDKAFAHISQCIVQATYNTSRPFVCTSCLTTLWII